MNIKQAKEEIRHAISAYLSKDEFGEYKIPVVSQRPILLIGPPGIGKTAIMEQVARECKVGLVAYTITHHTRQSAIGLPYIEKKMYAGKEYPVTEYTMSEIIASVYEKIEESGLKEGILFIDEINCVSETLSATMLQFLQGKSFGAHKVPEGFIIVAAGNPPEYNKSVKEFDIVTLDRVRRLDVVEDYTVWKEYASKAKVHNAVLSYLDIKKENFYTVESTIEGKQFVTARGWEDLSRLLYVYEEQGIKITEDIIYQYLQQPSIAKDFSNYYDLYNKYKTHYDIQAMLSGTAPKEMLQNLMDATFDERISVISLFLSKLYEKFQMVFQQDAYVTELYDALKKVKEKLYINEDIKEDADAVEALRQVHQNKTKQLARLKRGNLIEKKEEQIFKKVLQSLDSFLLTIQGEKLQSDQAFQYLKSQFDTETTLRTQSIEDATNSLTQAFLIMEEAFLNTPEMVMFLTELTMNYYSGKFISEYGSEAYYKYNKEILLTTKRKDLLKDIENLNNQTLQ